MEQSVKLSISNDGMEHYRKHIQQNGQETYDDILQRRELLKSGKISDVDYGYEISKKAAELNKDAANAGKKALSTTDRANGYVAVYAELYDEIVQGYESGTREIYVTDENGTHKLTKDEELSNLDAAYKKTVDDFVLSVAHGWSYMLAVVSLHCSLKCCKCTMNLHIYRNVDYGRCCPDNNDTGTTVLLLEVADILTKKIGRASCRERV